ncbi:Ovarian cancer-associated protein 2, partial [Linderina pennispora]
MSAKPKILCLHGYAENGELFQIKSRNFRRVIGDNAELVYPTAPIDVGILRATAEELLSPNGGNDFRNFSWWWTKSAQRIEVRGLDKSLKVIAQILNEQ